MGGFDDHHVAIVEDWMPPSPSPRTFLSGVLGDEISSRSISELSVENKTGLLFPWPQEQIMAGRTDEKDGARASFTRAESTKSGAFSGQKMSSRGGLLERIAARAGFNAPRLDTERIRPTDLSLNPDIRSPYLTIPPGLSPTTLLESPVFLSNSLAQPSPTTGKFPFSLSGNGRNSSATEVPGKSKDNLFEDINTSFAFKPFAEAAPSLFLGSTSKITPSNFPQQNLPGIDGSAQPENSFQSQNVESAKAQSQNGTTTLNLQDFSRKDAADNTIVSAPMAIDIVGAASTEHSPPPYEQQDEEANQRGGGDTMVGGAPSEDGYNWRKYGQKQVKGSEYPRSYYKCTHPNCPVKKKVERSHEGHITEIIYKGAHNHRKPPPNRRSGSLNLAADMQLDIADQMGAQIGDPIWTNVQKGTTSGGAPDWRNDNLEVTSSASVGAEYSNAPNSLQGHNGTYFESGGDAVDASSTFSNDEDEDDQGTHGSISLCYDGEGDESESKKRKIEVFANEMSGATRAIREPRVVVQTTSDVDILDDGYRWRKYGQKVVKGNPNPRSYYKCTSAGCTVRKHVERASHDLKSVITTYEGKHNHDVPAARNSSHVNSSTPNNGPAQSASVPHHLHRPEPSQLHSGMARFDQPPALSSFGLSGRQQLGPPHGFSFGMNQPGLANLAMAGFGPSQGKLPVMSVHPYLGHQRLVSEMGFALPKGEPKVEPLSEPPLNLPNGSSVYHQIMSRLPLGPQM
ncbi:WRKY Transcription Factor [Sarracenia purpurea var. burkii]